MSLPFEQGVNIFVGTIESMKLNMNQTDRIVRLIGALMLSLLFYFGILSGILGYVGLAVAGVFIATAIFRFCPIYAALGWTTCKSE